MLIERRSVIKGLATLPLAVVLADPLIARAVAAGLDEVTITTAGGKRVSAALALPTPRRLQRRPDEESRRIPA